MTEISWSAFEEYVDRTLRESHVPGISVAVAKHGEIIYAKGFGLRDRATGDRADPDTVFGIASVSKSFTALAIMQLVDSRRLSVNDSVTTHVPEFCIQGVDWLEDIKIHHLLSHTSGLPPLPGLRYATRPSMRGYPRWDDTRPEDPPAVPDSDLPDLSSFPKYIDWLSKEKVEMLGRPGEYYSYSNDGYCILARLLEQVTGCNYYAYMREHVLDAVGMPRSTYNLSELPSLNNITRLYFHNIRGEVLDVPQWQDIKVYDAGGGIRSTALDMAKWGQVFANSGMSGASRIVSAESIARMSAPVHKVGKNSYYCYGLRRTPDYSGFTLMEHGGSLTGVGAAFGFVPEKGLSAVVLANVTRIASSNVWLAAVNTALGLPMEQKRSEEEAQSDVTLEQIAKYSGLYKSGEGASFRIVPEDNTLQVHVNGLKLPLKASDESTLVYELRGSTQAVRFFSNDSGSVWAAFHGGRMVRKIA